MKKYIIKRFNGNWEEMNTDYVDNVQWTNDYGIRAEFQIGYDDNNLYVHLIAKEEDIRNEEKDPLSSICADSCLEFFFQPIKDGRYFNFEVNMGCHFYVGFGKDRNSHNRLIFDQSILNAKSNKTDDGWQVYYTIPVNYIQIFTPEFKAQNGKSISANIYKCGDKTKHEHYITWNKVESANPDYHRPECFGEMIFD